MIFHIVIMQIIADWDAPDPPRNFLEVAHKLSTGKQALAILCMLVNTEIWTITTVILWYHTAVEFDMTADFDSAQSGACQRPSVPPSVRPWYPHRTAAAGVRGGVIVYDGSRFAFAGVARGWPSHVVGGMRDCMKTRTSR